jgi:hypothetical protein
MPPPLLPPEYNSIKLTLSLLFPSKGQGRPSGCTSPQEENEDEDEEEEEEVEGGEEEGLEDDYTLHDCIALRDAMEGNTA